MMNMRVFIAAATAAAAAGCGLSSSTLPNAHPAQTPGSNQSTAAVIISVPAPPSASARNVSPLYVSPATKSISITVNGGPATVANLTPTSPGCTPANNSTPLTCTVTVPAAPGNDTFTLTTFDHTGGTGKQLSTASVAATIVIGQANVVPVTLQGIISSIHLVLANPHPMEGLANTIGLTINAKDADGNIIIGPGNYNNAITLSDSDSTYTSLSTTSVTAPTNAVTVSYDGGALNSATISASAVGATSGTVALTPTLVFKEFSAGVSGPQLITTGPDGNLWFTGGTGTIGRMTSAGTVTTFTVPTANAYPWGIASGPDGNLWFTEVIKDKVGRITPSGAFTEFPIPSPGYPFAIAAGPDGNLWFAEDVTGGESSFVGQITTAGTITEYQTGTTDAPYDIVSGTNGTLWNSGTNQLVSVNTSGQTAWTEPITGCPTFIALGPDNNFWYTGSNCAGGSGAQWSISQLDGVTGAVGNQYFLPTTSTLLDIAAGPDGNLWFADEGNNSLGRITTSGVITEFSIPTAGAGPYGVAVGPDGNIWFTEQGVSQIGRFLLTGPHVSPGSMNFSAAGQTQGFTVSESHYSGSFAATSSNLNCATVSPSSGTSYTVTAVAAGYCTVDVLDTNGNQGTVYIVVGTTTIVPESRGHHAR